MGEGTDDFSSIDLEQQYPRDIESSRHRDIESPQIIIYF